MNYYSITDINANLADSPESFVIDCEAQYDKMLRIVAEDIRRHASERPIALIAGPSGSGKTTTAHRLERLLDGAGLQSHTLSMDDYYADGTRNKDVVDQYGNPDYESPRRLDTDLLNTQLLRLARCEPVELPQFNFAAQKQEKSGRILRRRPNELIVMEGIHALNPEVTGGTTSCANKIYLSVRTRVTDDAQHLHPSLIRFARRLIRDRRTRGRDIMELCELLPSISRGENLYIMPYKHLATHELDTFIPYELSAYRNILLEELRRVSQLPGSIPELRTLLQFLEKIAPMDSEWIPEISLVREFIGGQCL